MLKAILFLLPLSLFAIEPFVVVTPPKSGTHLLTKAIEMLTKKECLNNWSFSLTQDQWEENLCNAENNNGFLQIHAHPYPDQIKIIQKLGYKVIFLLRDPRDQAISLLFYIEKGWSFGPLDLKRPNYASLELNEKLDEIITGKRFGCSGVKGTFSNYIPWFFLPDYFCCKVRFEDLVGEKGGGSYSLQVEALKKINSFLELDLQEEEIIVCANSLFGKPGEKTFRKGLIGEWKTHFTESHSKVMDSNFAIQLKELGFKTCEEEGLY